MAGFVGVSTNVGFRRLESRRLHPDRHDHDVMIHNVTRRLVFRTMAAGAIASSTLATPVQPAASSVQVVSSTSVTSVVDMGSPFLLIPGSCGANTRSKAGCYREQGIPSGLPDTYEQFDGFEGTVEWRMASVTLENATGSLMTNRPLITLGVAGESILGGPGGVFFGLVRDTEDWIRPSFLSQTLVSSFQLDLGTAKKTLTLSQEPWVGSSSDQQENAIRLTLDLRRKYGDPVSHYTCRAQSISVNGSPLVVDSGGGSWNNNNNKPIYVIFDTGVTGMVVSRDLFNERYTTARQRKERNLWGKVDIAFSTLGGKTVTLSANNPLTTPFDPQQNWKKFRGHLIVVGLAFLDGKKITVDIDRKSILLEN